jgi:hypothetical protein
MKCLWWKKLVPLHLEETSTRRKAIEDFVEASGMLERAALNNTYSYHGYPSRGCYKRKS